MQTVIETGHSRDILDQTSQLFNFEAEYSRDLAERTVVPPAIAENPSEIATQLTDDVWLLINGEKGSGKTSCLYYTRHELRASSPTSIPVYVAFDSEEIKSEVKTLEERSAFLVSYFYRPLMREVISFLHCIPRRSRATEEALSEMIYSLRLSEKDLRYLAKLRKQGESSSGLFAWLARLFRSQKEDALEIGEVSSGSPDFVEFREALQRLVRSIGSGRVFLLVDEVNEQRLSKSQQEALLDHLYNTYRSAKEWITIKLAKTSSVAISDFIFHGHYFMPMELSSTLIHPYEYEEMLRSIFDARLKAIRRDEDSQNLKAFSDYFTENSFHVLAEASMGNVREFFFLCKLAYNLSLPAGKIEHSHAQRVIRSRAAELEERVKARGEDAYSMYQKIASSLKERSNAKSLRASTMDGSESSSEDNAGVSYFTISNLDLLLKESREVLELLEDEKIIFGTNEWKSLRRKGTSGTNNKQQLYVFSYLMCTLWGIRWHDVPELFRNNLGTEREIIDQHRCQISI